MEIVTCQKCKKVTASVNALQFAKDGEVTGHVCRTCWQASAKLEFCHECKVVYHIDNGCLCDVDSAVEEDDIDDLTPDELYLSLGHG